MLFFFKGTKVVIGLEETSLLHTASPQEDENICPQYLFLFLEYIKRGDITTNI